MFALLTTSLIIAVKWSPAPNQVRIDKLIVTRAVNIKGVTARRLIISSFSSVNSFLRGIIVVRTKPAVHIPVIAPLSPSVLSHRQFLHSIVRWSLKRGELRQIMSVFLCKMEKEKQGESRGYKRHKIEMTNGAYKRYVRRLIRHFNLDSAARVCSALRRANIRRGTKRKLKNVRAKKWSIRGKWTGLNHARGKILKDFSISKSLVPGRVNIFSWDLSIAKEMTQL